MFFQAPDAGLIRILLEFGCFYLLSLLQVLLEYGSYLSAGLFLGFTAQRAQWDLNKIEITLNGTFVG